MRKIYLLPIFFAVLCFVSCSETKEPGKYDNWKERNIAFIDSLQHVYDAKTDPDLEFVKDRHDERINIFYKVLEKGKSNEKPLYTSTVKVFYRGMFINEAVFGASNEKNYTKLWRNLDVFDSNIKEDDPDDTYDTPMEFEVNGVVSGWSEVLQQMSPGDRWELYIPYQSGYGSAGRGSILGYSTLIFDVTMLSFEE
jgi:FKBP-type peptidyl-prolyl cis-trans isomerases 1